MIARNVALATLIGVFLLRAATPQPSDACIGLRQDGYERRVPAVANYHTGAHRFVELLLAGEAECAEDYYRRILILQPSHSEALMGRALALAGRQHYAAAVRYLDRAVDTGLSRSLIAAIPDTLLHGLEGYQPFITRYSSEVPLLVHGPMLGDVTTESAKIWLRTDRPAKVAVEVAQAGEPGTVVARGSGATTAGADLTAQISVRGLSPGSEYVYRVLLDDTLQPGEWHLRTFPSPASRRQVRIGFGGCAEYIPPHEHMWNVISSHQLDAFLFLGDNVYIDAPTQPILQRYTYYRRQSRPEFRNLVGSTPIYAVWDDHDFGRNNSLGGSDPDSPAWKHDVLAVFHENWIEPASASTREGPGVWFSFVIGDIELFLLDGRYHRSERGESSRTMLGQEQKDWLLAGLAESTSTFKVIASPVPWAPGAASNADSSDSWDGFAAEREEIFSFIRERGIGGVVLLSADRHRSDYWIIPQEGGYSLPEFESSRLTNYHRHSENPSAVFSYNNEPSFGELTFSLDTRDPAVKYSIYNLHNELVFEVVVPASQLQP